ncbi:hypothetical protein [Modestobacter sp. URMC 112]
MSTVQAVDEGGTAGPVRRPCGGALAPAGWDDARAPSTGTAPADERMP